MAPVSNAERQRKYRERLKQNPVKYEELRKKHLERVKCNKLKIKEQNESQKERTRRKWREYSDRYYKKKKNILTTDLNMEHDVTVSNIQTNIYKLKSIKLKKELKRCQNALNLSLKRLETMRKQIYRLKKKLSNNRNQPTRQKMDESPQSTPTKFEIITESLSSVYRESTSNEKRIIKKIVNNSLTKKYRLVTKIGQAIGIKGRIRTKMSFSQTRKLMIRQIHNFYLRDDISRATAGKKECKTKEKTKMQIRFLTDTILNLYKIYKREGGTASYSTLVRHRPFYVLPPKLHNRDTCACIRHANISLKIERLYKLKLLKTNIIVEILKDIACNLDSKECMYGDCQACSIRKIEVKDFPSEKEVCWLQWCMKTVPYKKKNDAGEEIEKITKKYSREIITESLSMLVQKFQEEAVLFKKHYFNMIHQQKEFRACIDNVKENEAVIIVDFSENYQCKYNSEIQSMHFSSSRSQITLHTGVVYLKNDNPAGFCSISPNNEHSPLTIWAHLLPVLHSIKYQHPEIDTLHFHSDGPTTQYRQKTNFALLDKFTKQLGFKYATWSYFEAAHRKNAADGIGGVLKRTLDMHVGYGKDVPNALDAFKLLKQETNIILYYVSDVDITFIKETYHVDNLCPLVGTMGVHQIITTDEPGIIKYRQISCFCGTERGNCLCYEIKVHRLFKKVQDNVERSVKVVKSYNTESINKEENRTNNVQDVSEPGNSSINNTNVKRIPVQKRNLVFQRIKKNTKEKENKPPKKKKKNIILFNSDSSDTDTQVVYAESDDSPYEGEESSNNKNKTNSKITILSDIRLHPDNQRYFDFNSPGMSSLHKTDPSHDISLPKHNNSSDSDSNFDIF